MLAAFLTQFPPNAFTILWKPFLQSQAKLEETLNEVARNPGMVFHGLVGQEQKDRINAFCREKKIPVCDLTGIFVNFIEQHSGISASDDYRALHHIDEFYHQRIRAMEFTLEHDDGLGTETLHKADIVLAGVSRTSKTPTSIYLAQQGYKVGNVSLAMGIDPPAELMKMSPKKVVGLVIRPEKLAEIRTKRNRGWEMGDTAYNDPDMVQEEITWSRRLFGRNGWTILDVTDYAIEETAARALEMLGLNPGLTE